jgi:hypothetical protein
MKLAVTHSELACYCSCPQKWEFQYRMKLSPKRPDIKLEVGIAGHAALEVFYTTQDVKKARRAFGEVWKGRHDRSAYPEDDAKFAAVAAALEVYFTTVGKADLKAYKIVYTERQFSVELSPGLVFDGRIDGLWVGRRTSMLVDHKFLRSWDMDINVLPLDHQVSRYIMAARREFKLPRLSTVIYNVVVKPANKIKAGETIDQYMARISALVAADPTKYFKRSIVHRSEDDLLTAMAETERVGRMLLSEDPPLWRNVSDRCSWGCPFKDVCMSKDQATIDEMFRVRKKRHEELDEPEAEP